MKNIFFLNWYYGKAIRDFFAIWKNYFEFIWKYFSVELLFSTLFSSWRRDVILHDWQGFRPIKAIERAIMNTVFRFFGAVARTVVIFSALLVEFGVAVLGTLLLFVWLFFPLLFLAALVEAALGSQIALLFLAFLVLFLIFVFWTHSNSKTAENFSINLKDLPKQKKLFERVCNRLGTTPGEIDKGIFSAPAALDGYLASINLTPQEFDKIFSWELYHYRQKEIGKSFWRREQLFRAYRIGKHWQYGVTPTLNKYSMEISKFDPSEYSDFEIVANPECFDMLKLILEKPSQKNALVHGSVGVGKKSLVHFLAKMIRENRIGSRFLRNKRVLLLDLGMAISSAKSEGQNVANFLHHIFVEALYAGNVILVLENIENYLVSSAGEFDYNISSILEEYLPLATFQMIVTTNTRNYHRMAQANQNVISNFGVVEIPEISEEKTMTILLQRFQQVERDHVIFTADALDSIVKRSGQMGGNTVLPERAIELAHEVLLHWRKNSASMLIDRDLVDEFVALKTGVPVGKVKQQETELLMNLEEVLHERIIGQDEAVRQISQALRKTRSGIGNTKRPVGNFLFLGPTGVGKTETAKALAATYFGSEDRMIRLDMSEYKSQGSLDWLIGSSQTNQPGRLTSQIKDNPFSLLLLDEIEKAHPDILDVFLQILDEGFVTDAFGERVSFRNAIIIATSNGGAGLIKKLVEQDKSFEEMKKQLINFVIDENIFKVEFLNRFDSVVVFKPLTSEELFRVVVLMLKKLSQRILEEKNIKIVFDRRVVDEIVKQGYDPIFGARSINRYINDTIEDFVAKKIISRQVDRGGEIKFRLDDLKSKN